MALRVLIVDDAPAMRLYIRRTLQMSGLALSAVFEAGDGKEGIAVLEREHLQGAGIDLVFTDINMPVMNGEEFVTQLQLEERLREVPVLVISTDATKTRVLRLRELGARGYISKPCAPEMIRLKVEQILGRDYAAALC